MEKLFYIYLTGLHWELMRVLVGAMISTTAGNTMAKDL
jgi:hypothetical protein